jgi:PhzF family phenazine biosynthesis protein
MSRSSGLIPVLNNEAQAKLSRRVRVFRVDAFTSVPCTGNPAAVVLEAEGLDTQRMQAITCELGGVDAAFVLPPDAPDHDLRVRFFNPRAETGLVGHATVAVHAVLETLGCPGVRRQKQHGGIVAIERLAGPAGTRYAFSQPPAPLHGPLQAGQLGPVLQALGLEPEELDPTCATVVAGAAGSRALIAVRSGATLARLQPDLPKLAALTAAGCPAGFFVYSLAPAIADCDTEARMFCPALGIPEDPVSGNAHAMLAVHLLAVRRFPDRSGALEFTGRQGHHLGRPGVLTVSVSEGPDQLRQVQVAGGARVVFDAALDF